MSHFHSFSKSLYILNYHDVSWATDVHMRSLGGTVTPHHFDTHVKYYSNHGELISIQDGIEQLQSGQGFDSPKFAFWFDDGFLGVRRYAKPILDPYGVTAGTSVCSRFVGRDEMFWRAKMAYLASVDGLRVLRSNFRNMGLAGNALLKPWTIEHFNAEIVEAIDIAYDQHSSECFRERAFDVFDTHEGIQELVDAGWLIANHSAAHYPWQSKHGEPRFVEQFNECEPLIATVGGDTSFWVLPFEHGSMNTPENHDFYTSVSGRHDKIIVRVCGKPNTPELFHETGMIYRSSPNTSQRYRDPL
jgi:peptidoglycan/xylan/chitin deacetylase (PgdA/CDA1 family)